MREPELTIGMPVYNSASTVRAALETLIAQTYDKFVLIISDDNSSDGTGEICREYASRDPRIRYVHQRTNRGPVSNFRFVLFEAATPFFMWAAPEDLWTPNFVERTLNLLVSNPEYVSCQSRMLVTTKEGESYFSTGSYALTGTWSENAVRFFRNPADNSRYYGIFRTQALRSVFPAHNFYAHEWAVSAGTLKFGKHAELPESLMIRDASALAAKEHVNRSERRFLPWRIFPLFLMTWYCLRRGYVPWTPAAFDALARLNLYIACHRGIFDFGSFGRRYVQTQSLSFAILGRYSETYHRFRNHWHTIRVPTSTAALPGSGTLVNIAPLAGQPPHITIVIVAKSFEDTRSLIESLTQAAGLLALEFVICDIGKTDVTGLFYANQRNVSYIRCNHDASYSIAANRSLSYINAGVIGFFEAETRIEREALQYLFASLTDQNGIVGPQVVCADGRLKAAGGIVNSREAPHGYGHLDPQPDHPRYKFAREVDFCPEAYLIKRDIFRKLAGFNEEYRTSRIAHIDLAFRARAVGHSCHYCPNSRVISFSVRDWCEDWRDDWDRFQCDHAAQIANDYENAGRDLSRVHDRAASARVLYIDADTPTPDQRSGSIDAINIIRILQDFGFRTTFVPENLLHQGKYTDKLQAMGVEAIYSPYYGSIHDLITEKNCSFDLVVICRADIAHRHLDLILKLTPTARIVFNTVDLHFLREMRGAELSGQSEQAEKARRMRESELASIRKADATIVLTNDEADIVRREAPGALVHVIPLVRDPPELRPVASFASRSGVVFVGTYRHPPNADAVTYFVKDIWPLVRRRLPMAVFRIVGSEVTPDIQALAGNGVEVVGFVADLDTVLGQSRVAVAPLRYGAGMKGKILSALLVGLPTVATHIGIEGFGLTSGQEILVEDDARQFADAVVHLYTDEEVWTRLSRNGLKFSRTNFSLDKARGKIRTLLSDVGFDMTGRPHAKLENAELLLSARQVQQDILKAKAICHPSKFSSKIAEQYLKHLSNARIRNFKRTINNNFYQWLPGNLEDNQFSRLLKFFHDRPSVLPLSIVAGSGRPGAVLEGASAFANSPCEQDHYFEFYTFFVGLLWHYVSSQDSVGLHETLEEPRLGDPLPIRLGNRTLSEDLANSLHEWLRVNRASIDLGLAKRRRVLEIGAGYGRLAYVFLVGGPCQYVIVDVASTLVLASWYLQNCFPHRPIFKYRSFETFDEIRAEFEAADICFLGSHQLELIPDDYFDITISISAFHEMTRDQVNHYKTLIGYKTKYIVYLKHRTASTNDLDGTTLGRADYILREPWRLILDLEHPIQSKFTELLFVRKRI
jgi:O-antigen biosynthesis protein